MELFIWFLPFVSMAKQSAWLPRDLFCSVELGEGSEKGEEKDISGKMKTTQGRNNNAGQVKV